MAHTKTDPESASDAPHSHAGANGGAVKVIEAAGTPAETTDNANSNIVAAVSAQLAASLADRGVILNHLRESALPSREATLQILADTKDILFPDHRLGGAFRNAGPVSETVARLTHKLREDLRAQIFLAHTYDYTGEGICPHQSDQADREALAFIGRLPALREMLASDAQAAYDGDPAAHSLDEIIFCYPGIEAIVTQRIAHELYKLSIPLLPRIMTEAAHSATGCDIHPGARIGKSFFIDHATGVVIGETAVIGERVKIYQGVTLGALSFPKDAQGNLMRGTKRHPTIEDEVVIYAGATILGGTTTIGRGSVIGGSCWITHSLPAGTKVILQEPQMLFKEKTPAVEFVPDWTI